MVKSLLIVLLIWFFLVQLYVNVRLTRDIFGWVPNAAKRKTFLCLVWLLPVVGALYVYRQLAPEWFTPDKDDDENQSAVSAGLLGLDAIFNPSSRNIIDALKKGEITIKAEGEMYDRKLPDFIDVDAEQNQMKNGSDKPE